jgi:hypothetical protein
MEYEIPDKIWLFRMVHQDNLAYILANGLHAPNPNFVPIGNSTLIQQRANYDVSVIPPNGYLGDYIPFYFGYRSPMLYNIKTGYNGIKQYPQEEIVYLCCDLNKLIQSGVEWCFTDGHAKNKTTQFFNDLADLDKIDWQTVYAKKWHNTVQDLDCMRRKQAEFLVKGNIFADNIGSMVVFNKKAQEFVNNITNSLSLQVVIRVNKQETQNDFYY